MFGSRPLLKQELLSWLEDIVHRFEINGGQRVLDDQFDFFRTELEKRNYTEDQAKVAYMHLLFGDYKYRGKVPQVVLSDFFPNDDEIKYASSRFKAYRVLTVEEYHRLQRKAHEAPGLTPLFEKPSQEQIDVTKLLVSQQLENGELKDKVDKLEERLREAEKRYNTLLRSTHEAGSTVTEGGAQVLRSALPL
jgi:hypothetical protein